MHVLRCSRFVFLVPSARAALISRLCAMRVFPAVPDDRARPVLERRLVSCTHARRGAKLFQEHRRDCMSQVHTFLIPLHYFLFFLTFLFVFLSFFLAQTLMDVIAGRKNMGKITGEILIDGKPQSFPAFNRLVSGVATDSLARACISLRCCP